uniref:PAAR motif-containing protein n=1 Tax=Candidatus Kentrum sp. DK TaxID=2126562 RepID=A0A450RV87_9GAMM|nr:MAG: hypothetical protein BECKDK2373B_GA0170837_100422 [Candidatus Kentron sp. DK]
MSDFILITGDKANFLPAFGAAIVVVRPGVLQGSGPATVNSKKVCVAGDEKKLQVPGCPYTAGGYVIPGTGTLKIAALAANQKAKESHTGGKAMLLKGGQFTAKFEVQSPAKQPAPPGPPIPDPMPQYSGQGMFVTTNSKFKAT